MIITPSYNSLERRVENLTISVQKGVSRISEKTKANIALFGELVPEKVTVRVEESDLIKVFVLIPNRNLARKVDQAYEIVLASSNYNLGFEYYPIMISELSKEAVKSFLDSD